MNPLYPAFSTLRFLSTLRISLLGALIAGPYGALHDQISYSLSPEYFTKVKFKQFSYLDFGWPDRIFATEIGFAASWWVGLAAGWFLARAGLAEIASPRRRLVLVTSFAIVIAGVLLGGIIGFGLGHRKGAGDLSDWRDLADELEVQRLEGFVTVAYLHAGGYAGAFVGLLAAIAFVRRNSTKMGIPVGP